ncbi:amidinotransferase [Hyaloraphidium curvatum]|nr:amidinotransferase [Hyaloraphidium curvatum]
MASPPASVAYGAQNSFAPIKSIMVRRPAASMGAADPEKWHYAAPIKLDEAQREHDAFVAIIREELPSCDIVVCDADDGGLLADSVFVHDPVLVTREGAILLRMGKELRRGEPDLLRATLERHGVPILGRLEDGWDGQGEEPTMEAGDTLWLDERTLCVGIGFRTNREGLACLKKILDRAMLDVDVLSFDLPYFTGPQACLHLLSVVSLVSPALAVVYPPLVPVAFHKLLRARGIALVEVPEKEFLETQGTNVLALSPEVCVMLRGNPVTEGRLREMGVRVRTYKGDEVSLKAEGGPTCLTRPIWR